MVKHIPNILTGLRLIIGFILFWYEDVTTSFIVLFCIAGLTDLIDGPIARATGNISELGAKLDSYADTLIYLTIGRILLFDDKIDPVSVWVAVGALCVIVISAFIGLSRFNSFFFIHTISGKLLGFSCFLLPFASFNRTLDYLVPTVCTFLVILAIESMIIQIAADKPDPDLKSAICLLKKPEK